MEGPLIGLCRTCRHARPVTSTRGATFWRCGLSERDPRFPKYPRLPVVRCAGYAPGDEPRPPGASGRREDRA